MVADRGAYAYQDLGSRHRALINGSLILLNVLPFLVKLIITPWRILDGKDPEVPSNALVLAGADGKEPEGQETQISDHSAAPLNSTPSTLRQLRLETASPRRARPLGIHTWSSSFCGSWWLVWVSCCWCLNVSSHIENKAGRSKRGKSIKAEPASYTAGSWGVGLRFRRERGNHSAVGAHTHHWFLL